MSLRTSHPHFVLVITLVALAQLVWRHGADLIGLIAAGLFVFAIVLLVEGIRVLWQGASPEEQPA